MWQIGVTCDGGIAVVTSASEVLEGTASILTESVTLTLTYRAEVSVYSSIETR